MGFIIIRTIYLKFVKGSLAMKPVALNITRIVLITIIAFISITIFTFSNQDAEESSSISGEVARILIEMQPKYKNITEEEKQELISEYQKPVRKLAHFSIYTLLGMSIAGLTCTYNLTNNSKISKSKGDLSKANISKDSNSKSISTRAAITLISGLLYAISDEVHQTFIAGRSGQVSDVLLDWSGIILGTIIVLGIYSLITNHKLKLQN